MFLVYVTQIFYGRTLDNVDRQINYLCLVISFLSF